MSKMYNCPNLVRACLALTLVLCIHSAGLAQTSSKPYPQRSVQAAQPPTYPGLGRAATAQEIAAWDIDVRPDFKGLPPGSGSVGKGQDLWEAKCASCHGVFGESNQVFSPLIGGTSQQDIQTGRVANLVRTDYPGRSTIMKLATLSTLWDYIFRAMPWNNPKTLSADDVYALTAFMLNLADVVPPDFVLSNDNIAEVQQRMPNRNGMQTRHALWPGSEFSGQPKPDTKNIACMTHCTTEPRVASLLPEYALGNHGNLREQNRLVGAQRGQDTSQPASATDAASTPAPSAPPATPATPATPGSGISRPPASMALTQKHSCTACHAMDSKLVGPSFSEIANRYAGKEAYLTQKIKSGGQGIWGPIPMPAQNLPDADVQIIAQWLAAGAKK